MPTTPLIQALQNQALYDHPVVGFEVIETHISWVILTGDYAYKIKKPLNLGFLDFSTLEQRHYYCQQELNLNRRLAPQLYVDVIPISGSAEQPILNSATGDPIEYAIKMRQFPQSAQLDRVLTRNELQPQQIDQLADTIATFHQRIEVAPEGNSYGTPEAILNPVAENFRQIRPFLKDDEEKALLQQLEQWSHQTFEQLRPTFDARKRTGFIRNCHGDMHLANIALINQELVIFDCIEFNDNFRWIDPISEIAFTTMDLIDRGQPQFAARLLDRYLQRTGDYAGLSLLQFYQVYRALVRAKVAAIRAHQSDLSPSVRIEALQQYRNYTQLAERFTHSKQPRLFIAHGVSGSGKTSLTQPLLEAFGMIRLRSDVERKRLYGLNAEARTTATPGSDIYSQNTSQRTYTHLLEMATEVCQSGYDVIIDATFLKRSQRQQFHSLAQQLNIPFVILHFYADETLLRQWIEERARIGKDASEATVEIMQQQLATEDPLTADEAKKVIAIDTGRVDADQHLINAVKTTAPVLAEKLALSCS